VHRLDIVGKKDFFPLQMCVCFEYVVWCEFVSFVAIYLLLEKARSPI